MIPFTRDDDGLRDYRVSLAAVDGSTTHHRWPWLVLILCLVGLALRAWH